MVASLPPALAIASANAASSAACMAGEEEMISWGVLIVTSGTDTTSSTSLSFSLSTFTVVVVVVVVVVCEGGPCAGGRSTGASGGPTGVGGSGAGGSGVGEGGCSMGLSVETRSIISTGFVVRLRK